MTINVKKPISIEKVAANGTVTRLGVSLDAHLENVRQVGNIISGDVVERLDFGVGNLTARQHFDFDAGIGQTEIDLGVIDAPILGEIPVSAVFTVDIPDRELTAELTLAGFAVAKATAHF
jgi:hypothetical protein